MDVKMPFYFLCNFITLQALKIDYYNELEYFVHPQERFWLLYS